MMGYSLLASAALAWQRAGDSERRPLCYHWALRRTRQASLIPARAAFVEEGAQERKLRLHEARHRLVFCDASLEHQAVEEDALRLDDDVGIVNRDAVLGKTRELRLQGQFCLGPPLVHELVWCGSRLRLCRR